MKSKTITPVNIIVFIMAVVFIATSITETTAQYCVSWQNIISKPFTLLTYLLCSTNPVHFAINSIALAGIYDFYKTEKLAFVNLFIICGITSGFISSYFLPGAITAGCSGAIYGLFGFATIIDTFIYWYTKDKTGFFWIIFWGLNIYITYAIMYYSSFQINWVNHICGAGAGILIACIYILLSKILKITFHPEQD